jgi:hypothetical protein
MQPFNSTASTTYQAVRLYQAVVTGEEVTSEISKGGKDFTCFLQLQTHW